MTQNTPPQPIPIPKTLLQVSIGTLSLMFIYELGKQWLYPNITPWYSHTITIILSTILAVSSAYIVLRRMNILYAQLTQELAEREATTRAYRESEMLYRETLATISDAVFLTDNDGILTFICPNVHYIFGYTAAEIHAFQHIHHLLGTNLYDQQLLDEQSELHNIERIITDKAGQQHNLLINVKQVNIRAGTVLYTCHDVTQRKIAKQALPAAHDQLEHQVAERTLELAQTNQKLAHEIEERTAAQRNLRRERDFAESLIQTAQVIIVVLSPVGQIMRINPYMEQLTGYPLTEIQGQDWFDTFLLPHERPQRQTLFNETLNHIQTSGSVVNTILTKTGKIRKIEWCNRTLHNAEGDILGLLAIGHDITERQQAETNLRQAHEESEQRVHQRTAELERRVTQLGILNDVGSQIAAILDLESVFKHVTALVQENFGYHHVGLFTLNQAENVLEMRARSGAFDALYPTAHALKLGQGMVGWVGQHGQTLLANDVATEPQYVNLYPETIPSQSELSVPIQIGHEIVGALDIQSPDREAFDDSDVMAMETLADQVAVAIANSRLYQAVQRELNERKQAEAALRESEARYHTVSDLISDIAFAITVHPNETLTVDWIAGAFARISGLGLDETNTPNQWHTLLHPDDLPIAQQAFETLLTCQPYECELRFLSRDNHLHWMHTRIHPVWDGDLQRVVRIIGAAQDITERKEMERLMLRTERLAAMGHITGTLAHEIKNPLQAINSNLELVLDFPLEPDERNESLNVCRNEVERLIDITQSVLSLAHSGKERYRRVDLVAQIERTLDLLRHPLVKATVQVITDFAEDLPHVRGDEDQIRQVLLNLALNAIEAMPNGGIINITAHTEARNVVLRIINDGPPIPKAALDHIFEPFFTTKPSGAGLGLFISHHIMQQHGGTLKAENITDTQTVAFIVTLPI